MSCFTSFNSKVYFKESKPVVCKTTGKIYASAHALARELDVEYPSVSNSIKRGYKLKGNYYDYVENYEKLGIPLPKLKELSNE